MAYYLVHVNLESLSNFLWVLSDSKSMRIRNIFKK